MNAAGWHWHVSLRWRAGGRDRVEVADLVYDPADNVMYVLTQAARVRGVPLRSVEGFNCSLVKP